MICTILYKFAAIKKIDDFAGANEMEMTFAIKLSGIMPGDLSSLLFGAMGISFKNYTIGANLGNLPLVIVYTFFGITLKNVGEQPWVAAIPVAVIIVFMLIASLITKRLICTFMRSIWQLMEIRKSYSSCSKCQKVVTKKR
jgi:uncharacterized membrane protein YdjX (TVP38/TMEM64 family)